MVQQFVVLEQFQESNDYVVRFIIRNIPQVPDSHPNPITSHFDPSHENLNQHIQEHSGLDNHSHQFTGTHAQQQHSQSQHVINPIVFSNSNHAYETPHVTPLYDGSNNTSEPTLFPMHQNQTQYNFHSDTLPDILPTDSHNFVFPNTYTHTLPPTQAPIHIPHQTSNQIHSAFLASVPDSFSSHRHTPRTQLNSGATTLDLPGSDAGHVAPFTIPFSETGFNDRHAPVDTAHSPIAHAHEHSVQSLSRVSAGDINVPQVPHLTNSAQPLPPQMSSSSLDIGPGGDVQRDIPTVSSTVPVARSDVVAPTNIDPSNRVKISKPLQDAMAEPHHQELMDIPRRASIPPSSEKGMRQSMGASSSRSGDFNGPMAVSIDSGMHSHKVIAEAPETLAMGSNPIGITSSQPEGRRVSFILSQDSITSSPAPLMHPTVGSSSVRIPGEGVRVIEAHSPSAGGREIVASPRHIAHTSTLASCGDSAKGDTLASSDRDTISDSVEVGNPGTRGIPGIVNRHHLQSRGGDGLGSTSMSGINGTIQQGVRHGIVEGVATVDRNSYILTGPRAESAVNVPQSSAEPSSLGGLCQDTLDTLGGEAKYGKGGNALIANDSVSIIRTGIKVEQNPRGTQGVSTSDERARRVSSSLPSASPVPLDIAIQQHADNASKRELVGVPEGASQVLHESSKSEKLTKGVLNNVRIQDHILFIL